MKTTKEEYVKYLNHIKGCGTYNRDDEDFIIGGKFRRGWYGNMLRRYDPIAFEVGYRDWRLDLINKTLNK